MMLHRAILGLLFAVSVCPVRADDAAPTPWPQECKLSQVASLPMTIKGGHITVPVSVNGKELPFILDTGGYGSGLSSWAAADLGLQTQDAHGVIVKDVGGRAAQQYVRTQTLGFGKMVGQGLPLMVLTGLNEVDNDQGLLAPDLLRNFDVELDFAGQKVNLFHHHPCDGRALYWTGSYAVLPFDVTPDGHIRVPVTLDGQDTHAIVDTGAPLSTISASSVDTLFSLNTKSPGMEKAGAVTGALGGSFYAYTYPFKTLTMGAVTVARPIVLVTDGENFLKGNQARILLGLSIVRQLHVYIAYKEGKLYVSDANAH
jgi:predicted aspartyl protease